MNELPNRSCPHCGAEVPPLPECLRCGIVFAKYRPRPSAARTGEVKASRSGSPSLAPWLAAAALLIAAAVVIGRGGDPPQPAAIPPQTMAPQPLPQAPPEPIPEAPSEPISAAAPEPASPTDLWNAADDSGLEAEPEPEPRTASAPAFEALASVGYDWFENASGFRSGLELAAAESRPIAVYFYTDWCGYCRQFERELLTRARVEDFTKYLVKVRINPESGPREREIADRYGVRGYPSFFVQASANASPRKIRQHKRIGGDWVLQTPSDFVTTLRRSLG